MSSFLKLSSENFEAENVMNYPTYYGEKSIWLIPQIFYFSFVLSTCHRQVLTPVNNFQLLLKLEILDKLKLVTFHKRQHKESATLKLVHTYSHNVSSHGLDSQNVENAHC